VVTYLATEEYSQTNYACDLKGARFSSANFPEVFARRELENPSFNVDDLIFKAGICHRCNMKTPSLAYCVPMYGSAFKRRFGWYVKQNELRLRGDGTQDPPKEVFENLDAAHEEYLVVYRAVKAQGDERVAAVQAGITREWPPYEFVEEKDQKYKEVNKIRRRVQRRIEDITRQEFGLKKTDDRWIHESLLFRLIQQLFPKQEIKRHYRPEWLDRLEIDIFLAESKVAIEYQGQQHYHPIKAWGGQEALKGLKARDKRKAKICHDLAIPLLAFDYREPLTLDHVRQRLLDLGVVLPQRD
jgi:hypothetical protein